MPYAFLKILCYGVALIGPYLVFRTYYALREKSKLGKRSGRLVLVLLIPAIWFLGLSAWMQGQAFHQAGWVASHGRHAFTEEEMLEEGDSPNAFAGWLLLGWMPLLLGGILARKRKVARK